MNSDKIPLAERQMHHDSSLETHRLEAKNKLLLLISLHLQNFQRTILTSRRRSQQRMRRRQAMLRAFYMQQRLELETSFMELLPIPHMWGKTDENDTDEIEQQQQQEQQQPVMNFYEDAVLHFNDKQWLKTFHVTRRSFEWFCQHLHEMMEHLAVIAPLPQRIAIALYALATGDDFEAIGMLFNVSRLAVQRILRRFSMLIIEKLGDSLIAMPKNENQVDEIRSGFQKVSNIPAAVVGVMGVYAFPIMPMQSIHGNDKLILEALIDDRLLFRKIAISKHLPASLFLYGPNEITKFKTQLINRQHVPAFVITPPHLYPLRFWLMHAYENPDKPYQYDFNEAVDYLLTYKEQALQRLISRWKILQCKQLDASSMELVLSACCILHNLLEEMDETYCPKWAEHCDLSAFDVVSQPRNIPANSIEAQRMRDFLARISSIE